MHVLVMAKAPEPGRVKTRLCPPCSPAEAAALATAALADTLAAALQSRADRVVLALDGRPGPWVPAGVEVILQHGSTFDERLTHAWGQTGGPGIQIGMDTPQVTPDVLDAAADALCQGDVEAVLGPAVDGGWWAIGLRWPRPDVFAGVPMSRPDTAAHQEARLRQLGLRVAPLPPLRDVDTFDDAVAVATLAPATRFARSLRELCISSAAGSAA